jgi:ferredoxin
MSYIIGSKCVGVCDTICVDVCPVDCIHGPIDIIGSGTEVDELREKGEIGDKQLYINPDECIDCGACLPECPVDAIYEDEDEAIEDGEKEYVKKNYEFFDVNMPSQYE